MSIAKLTLKDYILAGYSSIIYRTSEELRALKECAYIAKEHGFKFLCWSQTNGIYDPTEKQETKAIKFQYNEKEYSEVLVDGLNQAKGTPLIFCLLDFHHFINNPTTLRAAKDIFRIAREKEATYIFISNSFEVPKDLAHEIVVFDFELPGKD